VRLSARPRLAIALAAGALVVLAVIVLAAGSGGGDDPAPAPLPPPPRAERTLSAPRAGITMRVPAGWTARRAGGGLTMRSADRSVALAVVRPRGATSSARVLREAARDLRRRYRVRSARPAPARRLAGLPAIGLVLDARIRSRPVRSLVSAAQGRRRAWLAEVFASARAPAARLAEGQVALNSLRLRG